MLSTCGRGPGPPQVGPGPPRAYPDPRELSAQLAAREGSGAATCHADAGVGASLPLEAPSPTRIKCEQLMRALLPLGTGQLLSVHTVDRQPSCRIKCWWLGRALPEQGIGYPLTGLDMRDMTTR